jgi:hypothetical protein
MFIDAALRHLLLKGHVPGVPPLSLKSFDLFF